MPSITAGNTSEAKSIADVPVLLSTTRKAAITVPAPDKPSQPSTPAAQAETRTVKLAGTSDLEGVRKTRSVLDDQPRSHLLASLVPRISSSRTPSDRMDTSGQLALNKASNAPQVSLAVEQQSPAGDKQTKQSSDRAPMLR